VSGSVSHLRLSTDPPEKDSAKARPRGRISHLRLFLIIESVVEIVELCNGTFDETAFGLASPAGISFVRLALPICREGACGEVIGDSTKVGQEPIVKTGPPSSCA
jgi:hypothetical protein